MITLYQRAYFTSNNAPSFAGRSIDTKPLNVPNGSMFTEIDTGRDFCFDAENKKWYECKHSGNGGGGDKTKPLIESIVSTKLPNEIVVNMIQIQTIVTEEETA